MLVEEATMEILQLISYFTAAMICYHLLLTESILTLACYCQLRQLVQEILLYILVELYKIWDIANQNKLSS